MACESETSKGNILERILNDPTAEPTNLPLSLLEAITNNFSEDQKIGTGGFADVYKGSLQNGTVPKIAVKKLFKKFMLDDKTFYQEVYSLMKVRHKNIVRFLGYCANTEEKFCNFEGKNVMADIRQRVLCFEFMPKGSLDQYISDAHQGLQWRMRYKILKGICEGLHYLHKNRILHLDLKPANILLNENMEPKISDFGLSRRLDENQSRVITSNVSGSMAYIAPECYMKEITFKSDIYSLGVMIFEILTGRKGYTATDKVLETWQTRLKKPEDDTQLEQVRVCTKIGIQCIDIDPEKRPATQFIIDTLYETDRENGFIETDICTSPATHENRDLLIKCVSQDLGFSYGKPIAACLTYRCLLHWRSFEDERTSVFDHIIESIVSAVKSQENNDRLPYWLSCSSALLVLLQPTRKKTGLRSTCKKTGAALQRGRSSAASFERSPAIVFQQQLAACVGNVFVQLREDMKKKISPHLDVCIQASKSTQGQHGKASRSPGVGSQPQSASNSDWDNIVNILDLLLDTLRENYVPSFFIRKLITQLFSTINVQLFNSLLLHRERCTVSYGEYVKAGLSLLEKWMSDVTEELAGTSWYELGYIRQAVGFLVMQQMGKMTLEEIKQDLCPALTLRQIYRLCKVFLHDKVKTQLISKEVYIEMLEIIAEATYDPYFVSNDYLLDEDLSIPFTTEDLSMAIPGINYADVDLPESLQHYTSLQFLFRQPDPQPAQ